MSNQTVDAAHAMRRAVLALVMLFLLALGVRVYYVSTAQVVHPVRGDAVQYVTYAWNLLQHHMFSGTPPGQGSYAVVADSFRDPGYPLFLAALMGIFGVDAAWYAGVLLSQALLGALTVVMAVYCARRWLPDRWALIAGLIIAVWPQSVTMSSYLLSETLVSFLLLMSFVLLDLADARTSRSAAIAAGLMFAAAGLTNAVILPVGAIFGISLAMTQKPKRLLWCIFLAANLLPILVWQVRDVMVPTKQSATSRAVLNFVQGSWPDFQKSYLPAIYGDPLAKAKLAAVDNEFRLLVAKPGDGAKAIVTRISTQPLRYAAWYASKPILLWGWNVMIGQGGLYIFPTINSPYEKNMIWIITASIAKSLNMILLLLAATGIALSARRPSDMIATAMAGLLLYITLVYGLLQSEPRYSFPFRPIEIVLAITALATIASGISRYQSRKRENGS